MKTHHLLSAVAVAIVAAAAPLTAQDSTRTKPDSTKPTQQQSAGDVAITANPDTLVAAIAASSATALKIQAATNVTPEQITFVAAPESVAGDTTDVVNSAVTKHTIDLMALRTAIDANAPLKSAIESKQMTSADVIGANVADDGRITVYYRKKPQ